MNIGQLAENLGLEEHEYREMLELFFDSGGADLARLEVAIADGNAEKAHEASHSLKGSAGSLGLNGIFELARAIDDKDRQGILQGLDALVRDLRREYDALVAAFRGSAAG
jgi:HPt (histidine-containing phosphotransfer) domain-containing protein